MQQGASPSPENSRLRNLPIYPERERRREEEEEEEAEVKSEWGKKTEKVKTVHHLSIPFTHLLVPSVKMHNTAQEGHQPDCLLNQLALAHLR